MVDPVSIGIGILVSNAPKWFQTLQETLLSKGKEAATAKGKERIQTFLDEKKHLRHMELALQNAAERGLKQWHTQEERDYYRSILTILSDTQSQALRQEATQLFTLSDNPDLTDLAEKYNLSQRITALAHHTTHKELDARPYLQSFFAALLVELYNDPLFRDRMSDIIRARATIQQQRTFADVLNMLTGIYDLLADNYSPEQLQKDVNTYLEYIENKYRLHKFAGIVFRGDEDKAPELDSIYVPLRIALQKPASPEEKLPDDLIALLERYSYLVLLGGPGSGKSTTTCHLAWSHARANLEARTSSTPSVSKSAVLPTHPLPLRIELRLLSEARRQNAAYSFLSYATKVMLGREDITLPTQMFETLLERRAMFVLFDGLDEVPTLSERRQLVDEIETFVQRYPGNHILVTSRPVGYDIASFSDASLRHGQIQDFDDEQIHQFLESWYIHVLKYTSLSFEIRQELELFYTTLKENPRLHRLAVNPLLLTVMTALHRYERLPDERVLIYEKCSDLLLDTWARLKHEGIRWKDVKMSKEDQKACLAHLGFILHQRSQETEVSDGSKEDRQLEADTAVDVPASFIRKEIKRFLTDQNLLSGVEQHAEAERFLELVRTEAGLIVSRGTDETGEPLYGFVHRTFQEYFAAVDVLNRYQQEDDSSIIRLFLAEHTYDPHWREVILLLFGKLKHKFATVQLRHILAGHTRRSSYTSLVKQDLFFVCDCLADGISVEKDFAQEVIGDLSQLIKETPFPAQRREAAGALVALLRTRQYADLSRQALQRLMTENTLSLEQQIQVAEAIYISSPLGSGAQQEGARLLIARYQQGDLSLEQQIQVAETIYGYSSLGSEERQEGLKRLKALFQQGDLSLEQQIQVAEVIYRSSLAGSEEWRAGARLLIARYQQGDLSLEQQIEVAEAIYNNSPAGSEERQEGARLLKALFQQGGLSLEQQILVAEVIYRYSPAGSEEQERLKRLKALFQQGDLSLEQQIQVAKAIYRFSPIGSGAQQEGARLLIARYQQGDLSLEQQIQVAEAICSNSFAGSEERQEGLKRLKALFQQGDLSLEQQIQLAEAIYRNSVADSEEQQNAFRIIWQYVQNPAISLEQRLSLVTVPCERYRNNFSERVVSVRMLLSLVSQEVATDILEKKWQLLFLHQQRFTLAAYGKFTADLPAIFELANQDVLPISARDEMYQLLRDMVPLFGQANEVSP
jgi:hypothetical protein